MKTINRRDALKSAVATAGATGLGLPLWQDAALAASPQSGTNGGAHFKRIVFFLQNHGFDPKSCYVDDVDESCPLTQVELAEPMRAFEPYKDMMTVISGLHGKHTSAEHSAYFGALGGYRGGKNTAPSAATVDYELSRVLPASILPQLCVGMDSLHEMQTRPAVSGISASGPRQGLDMTSSPLTLYRNLFGSISQGDLKLEYDAELESLRTAQAINAEKGVSLPVEEARRYESYVGGYDRIVGSRDRLAGVSDRLRRYAPRIDQRYTDPKVETEWHDAILEITIAALQANITNVATIASGRGTVGGSWSGLGVEKSGHLLGHTKQMHEDDNWTKIRHYNCQMLVKLIKGLEAVPEGRGTMMDNTLIVYTSNNAEKQHSRGEQWPFVLIGSGGGRFQGGRFIHLENKRPINDLYATLLRAAGKPVDRFNLNDTMANITDSQVGPIEEILA